MVRKWISLDGSKQKCFSKKSQRFVQCSRWTILGSGGREVLQATWSLWKWQRGHHQWFSLEHQCDQFLDSPISHTHTGPIPQSICLWQLGEQGLILFLSCIPQGLGHHLKCMELVFYSFGDTSRGYPSPAAWVDLQRIRCEWWFKHNNWPIFTIFLSNIFFLKILRVRNLFFFWPNW